MNKLLSLTFTLMLGTTMAFAQAGSIGIFDTMQGTDCNLQDGPGSNAYYVVHANCSGARAAQFSAPKPACSTAVWLSDEPRLQLTIGNSQEGVFVYYGFCRISPIVILEIDYWSYGTTPGCCRYPVLPHPSDERITAWDCNNELWSPDPTGGQGIIMAIDTCDCNVPTEDTTWGAVKALYTD